jgi:hypothetical protein
MMHGTMNVKSIANYVDCSVNIHPKLQISTPKQWPIRAYHVPSLYTDHSWYIQIGLGAHPPSCKRVPGLIPGGKAIVGAWS